MLSFQFVVNPSAGQGKYKWIIHEIERTLSEGGPRYNIGVPSRKGEAVSIARRSADNYDVVVAVGGDGTVNEVINGIIGTQAILGIIPAGTGNGFAREFNLPLQIREACKILMEGHIKWIDVGMADGRYFVGTAGLGFDALIAKFAGEVLGPLRGMWIYFFAGILMFYKYRPPLIIMRMDTQTVEVRPLLIAIANTRRYGGRALIAPHANPDDGLFDICVIRDMRDIQLIRHLPKLFKGKHTELPEVKIYRSDKVSINSSVPVPVHVDGEPIDEFAEIQFVLLPKALRILVPKN